MTVTKEDKRAYQTACKQINGEFMIKNHLKIALMALIFCMCFSLSVFCMNLNDDDIIKEKTTLALDGDVDAQYDLAVMCSRKGENTEAAFWFAEAKNNGHILAEEGMLQLLKKIQLEEKELELEVNELKKKENMLNLKLEKSEENKINLDKKYDKYISDINKIESEINNSKENKESAPYQGCNLF